MYLTNIPSDLKTIVNSEEIDFIVKAKKEIPIQKVYGILFFSVFWNLINAITFIGNFKSFFKGIKFEYSIEYLVSVLKAINKNLSSELILFFGIFLSIGIGTLLWSVYLFFKKGGYFVGTKTRLIKYRKGKIKTIDWEMFTGNMKIRNNGLYGNIALELRTGSMKRRNSDTSSGYRYVPDIINILGIQDVLNIETKCRRRIKENDPTPTFSSF